MHPLKKARRNCPGNIYSHSGRPVAFHFAFVSFISSLCNATFWVHGCRSACLSICPSIILYLISLRFLPVSVSVSLSRSISICLHLLFSFSFSLSQTLFPFCLVPLGTNVSLLSHQGQTVACVYTHWLAGSLHGPARPVNNDRRRDGLTRTALASFEDVLSVGCCPLSGYVVAGGAASVTVFSYTSNGTYDLLMSFAPRCSPQHVSLCQQYIGYASGSEAYVIRVELGPSSAREGETACLVCEFDADGEALGLTKAMTLSEGDQGPAAVGKILGPITCVTFIFCSFPF